MCATEPKQAVSKSMPVKDSNLIKDRIECREKSHIPLG